MPQVIVKAEPDKFFYALATNKGRRAVIREGCSSQEEIVARCAAEFRRHFPSASEFDPSGRSLHKQRIDRFHTRICHIRLCKRGDRAQGGFVVLDGELMGLHNVKPGTGDWMMREAVKLGANRLDTYDVPQLIDLYERHGFKEILREQNTTKGQPDVVWMRREV